MPTTNRKRFMHHASNDITRGVRHMEYRFRKPNFSGWGRDPDDVDIRTAGTIADRIPNLPIYAPKLTLTRFPKSSAEAL